MTIPKRPQASGVDADRGCEMGLFGPTAGTTCCLSVKQLSREEVLSEILHPERRPPGQSGGSPLKAERIRLALDVGRTGIWVLNTLTGEFTGDAGLSSLWGLPRDVVMTTALYRAGLHPEDTARVDEDMHRAARDGGPDTFGLEFRILHPADHSARWVSLQGRRYRPEGPEGPLELIGMARDVTARKERDVHVHLLVREVTHRSKNLLAIIQAMARHTVKDSLSAAEFEQRFSARLRGLAVSHDLLAARDWHGAAVKDLVRWQLGPIIEQAGGKIRMDGPDLFLKPEAAQNIGLAFNELATNAVRYGALSASAGEVSVTWSIDPPETVPRRFHISWSEAGGPQVKPPNRHGFGHKVVERLTARALDGTVSLTFASSGLQWSLHIPSSFVLDEGFVPPVMN